MEKESTGFGRSKEGSPLPLLMHLPVFQRRDALRIFEGADEKTGAVIADLGADFTDGHGGVQEQSFGLADAQVCQVV